MKRLLLVSFLFFFSIVSASTITLIQELNYNQKKNENKNMARNNAVANMKNLLLEDAINMVISKKSGDNEALNELEKQFIRDTIQKFEIITEKWSGNSFYIKGQIDMDLEGFDKLSTPDPSDEESMSDDPDAVLAKIRKYRSNALKTKQELAEMQLDEKYINSENQRLTMENYRQGRIAQTLKRYKTSIFYYNKAIDLNPNIPNIYFNLGVAYTMIGDNLKAIKAYKTAINKKIKNPKTQFNLGICYDNIKNYDKAVMQYKEAIKLNPDYVQAYYNLGSSLLAKGKYDDAIVAYEKVLEYNPDFMEVYYNIAYVYDEKEDYTNSIIHYKKAVDLNPDYVSAISNLGFAYYNNEEYKLAIMYYKIALKLDTQDSDIFLKLGLAYDKLEFKDEMIEAYQNAAELGDKKAKKYLKKEGIAW
ncbi:MAG: tetratricopeptide repeat protein [Candidatus Cloacimonetes bacterium]|nr:tetratricopeptide repeat protein [Candidatus Cloacimonadota bacterium]